MRQAPDRGASLAGMAILLGLVAASPARPAAPPKKQFSVKVTKNIDYYDGPGQDKVKHKLDLYLPDGARDFPVLFFVHGGAWVFGDRSDLFGMLYGGLGK